MYLHRHSYKEKIGFEKKTRKIQKKKKQNGITIRKIIRSGGSDKQKKKRDRGRDRESGRQGTREKENKNIEKYS